MADTKFNITDLDIEGIDFHYNAKTDESVIYGVVTKKPMTLSTIALGAIAKNTQRFGSKDSNGFYNLATVCINNIQYRIEKNKGYLERKCKTGNWRPVGQRTSKAGVYIDYRIPFTDSEVWIKAHNMLMAMLRDDFLDKYFGENLVVNHKCTESFDHNTQYNYLPTRPISTFDTDMLEYTTAGNNVSAGAFTKNKNLYNINYSANDLEDLKSLYYNFEFIRFDNKYSFPDLVVAYYLKKGRPLRKVDYRGNSNKDLSYYQPIMKDLVFGGAI